MSDEPVGYLGGDTQAPGDDPYAASPGGHDDPYGQGGGGPADGGQDDEEVAGYLGGSDGEPEELPALPAQADGGAAAYSHRDFMGDDEAAVADPYADPYAAPAEEFEDPYALPPEAPAYEDYEGYDTEAMAQADPGYFDSMGHDEGADPHEPSDYGTATTEMYADEDDSPKTISQQDAESIIRRITTKRILPPESQTAPVSPPRLTASEGGLRIWPILLVMVILGAGGVFVFRVQLAEQFPWLAPYLGVELKQEVTTEIVDVIPREVKLKRALQEKVLKSELKAFGLSKDELKPATPVDANAPGGTKAPEGPK